jgi:hypothetical protein
MTVTIPAYVTPALPATVLRSDGKTLHIMTNNPSSTVDPDGDVVLNVTKIDVAKIDESIAATPALIESQGSNTLTTAQDHDSPHATIDITA